MESLRSVCNSHEIHRRFPTAKPIGTGGLKSILRAFIYKLVTSMVPFDYAEM